MCAMLAATIAARPIVLGTPSVLPSRATACLAWLDFLDVVSPWGYLAAGAVLLVVAYLLRYQLIIRLPLWILRRTVYRLRVHGQENVPATGPALLVCNHVSHIDSLLLLASQKRRVRFIVWAPYLRIPIVKHILRLANVIPIDSTS